MNTTISQEATQATCFKRLKITSPALTEGGMMPAKYTCDGENISPPLTIGGIPEGTKSLAVILTGSYQDEQEWTHWTAWNIPPLMHLPEGRKMEMEGLNYFLRKGYEGPCPAGSIHNYQFRVYALDRLFDLPANILKPELDKAIRSHILGFGTLGCIYQRNKQKYPNSKLKFIRIDDDLTLGEIKKEFNIQYPFLKLEFFKEEHGWLESSEPDDQFDQNRKIREIRNIHTPGFIELHDSLKTGTLERLFKRQFDLNVQVYRLYGDEWIQTTGTDGLTLEEQNEAGRKNVVPQQSPDLLSRIEEGEC